MRVTLARSAVVAALLVAGCGGPSTSPAPGPSAAGSATGQGAAARGPLVELTGSGGRTVVRVLDPGTRRALGSVTLDGGWTLPIVVPGTGPEGATTSGAIALTGPVTGGRSRFAVLVPPYTEPVLVDLPAGFGYDALSPDGGRLYLVEHLPPAGSEHYQVRAYRVAGRTLDPAVVVDKAKLDEWMAGRPVSRATSPDGVTVATLYQRAGEPPFIHVLNTVDSLALCLDLPASAAGTALRLGSLDSAVLMVTDPTGAPRFRADLATAELRDLAAG